MEQPKLIDNINEQSCVGSCSLILNLCVRGVEERAGRCGRTTFHIHLAHIHQGKIQERKARILHSET